LNIPDVPNGRGHDRGFGTLEVEPVMRLRLVAGAYALWILSVWLAFYIGHGRDENALQIAVIGAAIPAGLQIFIFGVEWRGLVAPMKIWFALLLVIVISYLAAALDPQTAPRANEGLTIPAAWTPVVYTINTAFLLSVATLVAGCPDRRLLREMAGLYCLFATPFLMYVYVTGETIWGRLAANDLEPNNWGLMGFTVCVAAFARKLGPIAVVGFVTGLATILYASSREHLLALAVVLLFLAAFNLQAMNRSKLLGVLAGACLALIALALFLDPYILDAVQYIGRDVLLVSSPDRGVDSGFTGRTGIWTDTLDLWLKWPILGVGFRQHEQYLAGWPAHNAYLAMLADTGLCGFVVYVFLLVASLIGSWGIAERGTRRFVVTAIIGYIVMGMFDRRTINAGNPYGILFVMCCSVALADHSLRRAAALRSRIAARLAPAHSPEADPPEDFVTAIR
jgi:O-antigen ligase